MQFRLEYKGPAVDAGRMSTRELGPAIFAVGAVLERASELAYGKDGKINVEVNADFEHGSFVVDFDLLQQGLELLGSEATQTVLAVLFGAGVHKLGVLGLIRKWAKGEKGMSAADNSATPAEPAPGAITPGDNVTTRGGVTINMSGDNASLVIARDPKIRQGIADITAPVRDNPGIESVAFYVGKRELERVDQIDAKLLEAPNTEETHISTDHFPSITLPLAIVPLYGKSFWRFVYNDKVFPAPILDDAWLAEAKSYRFGAGDALQVEAEVQNIRKGAMVDQRWRILKVHRLISADQPHQDQVSLLRPGEEAA